MLPLITPFFSRITMRIAEQLTVLTEQLTVLTEQ